MVDQEKCTMQSALNVEKNVKYHSNLTQVDLYTAEIVTLKSDPQEVDIKFNKLVNIPKK
jgi:hypothetical protein